MLLPSSALSMHVDHMHEVHKNRAPQYRDLRLSPHLSYSPHGRRPRVTGSSPSVHPKPRKGFLSNFYYIIESDGDGDDDEFRFNDASIHEGHLRQNGILTLVVKRLKI